MTATKRHVVGIPEELYQKTNKYAQKGFNSPTTHIIIAIEEYLAKYDPPVPVAAIQTPTEKPKLTPEERRERDLAWTLEDWKQRNPGKTPPPQPRQAPPWVDYEALPIPVLSAQTPAEKPVKHGLTEAEQKEFLAEFDE